MIAADAGAEDIEFGEITEIFVELEEFQNVQLALEEAGISMDEANVVYDPNVAIELSQDDAFQVMNLIEKIEDLDDVQNVYSNLDVTDEAIAALEGA